MTHAYRDYGYHDAVHSDGHDYLLPKVLEILGHNLAASPSANRIFEFGCGNGAIAAALTTRGYRVSGVDLSESGIRQAKTNFPQLDVEVGSVYDDHVARVGHFPVVMSLEVIEHLYSPRQMLKSMHAMLESGGMAVLSTPYHGYWKNLALALTGKLDGHFTVLWDGGHIKFWSINTLGAALAEAGFVDITFHRVGRIPPLAKSMIATARKR